MRIAHVTATFPPYWGGTGNVAYHNARVLHERGHDVTVFTAPSSEAFPLPFEVARLPAPLRLGNAPFTPALLRRLVGFDLIHLHHAYIFGSELTLLASARSATPLVVTYHNRLHATRGVRPLLFGLYNATAEALMLRRADRILAVQRDHFLGLFPALSGDPRVVELPNGVDTDRFRPLDKGACRLALGLPAEARVALFVGALDSAHWFKNVDGLIRAFAAATTGAGAKADETPRYLLVSGDGDLRPRLEAVAADAGVAERVRFLGARPQADLPPVYSAADVTVLPSLEVESFGMVLIESMACGTPVIASALPGVRTVVEHDADGLLVAVGNADELTGAVARMLDDRSLTNAMGTRGRRKVERLFDWQVVGDRLETIYRETLARRANVVEAAP